MILDRWNGLRDHCGLLSRLVHHGFHVFRWGLSGVLFPRFGGSEGSDSATGEVTLLGRAVPEVMRSVAIFALLGLVTGALGVLQLLDLTD